VKVANGAPQRAHVAGQGVAMGALGEIPIDLDLLGEGARVDRGERHLVGRRAAREHQGAKNDGGHQGDQGEPPRSRRGGY
jgi:hypothetical protein